MANRNDHSDKKPNAKTATTRQQDQERGQDQDAATGQNATASPQQTRDKGTVPVRDDDASEDETAE